MNDSWQFNLPIRNATSDFGYKRPVQGTRLKVEIIDTWEMTIKQYPETFETSQETDYRVFDKDYKKVRLPFETIFGFTDHIILTEQETIMKKAVIILICIIHLVHNSTFHSTNKKRQCAEMGHIHN